MQLNNTQRKIIIAMIIIMVGMLLFPPFHLVNQADINLGYSFLLSPPDGYNPKLIKIDALLLLTQWFGVLSIGALLVLIFKTPHETQPAPEPGIKPIKTRRIIAFVIVPIIASFCLYFYFKYGNDFYKYLNSLNLEIGHIEEGYRYIGGDPYKDESWELLPPKVGDIEEGYRYKGGDPGKKENWERIPPKVGDVEGGYRYVGGEPGSESSWDDVRISRGTVRDGYRYKGGDPKKNENWEPVSGQNKTP